MNGPHLVTASGPDLVRIELHTPDASAWVEGDVTTALGNAWCILDSARLAAWKAGRRLPLGAQVALRLLGAIPGVRS